MSTLVRVTHSMRWACSDMRACAELSFVCFLVDFFGYGGGGNTNTHVHVGPFFLAMPSHFLSLVMTVSFLFLLLRVVHMSRFLVCSLSDTRALVQNVLDLSRLS